MTPPTVSVLIVSYNDYELLKRNLPIAREIMLKSGYSFEIIGVDNGSHDGSAEMLSKYCDAVLRIMENKFYVPALNQGYKACKGELILVTCPDMTWTTSVTSLIEFAVGHSSILVAPSYRNLDGTPQHYLNHRNVGFLSLFFQSTIIGQYLDKYIARYALRRRFLYEDFEPSTPFEVEWTGGMFILARKYQDRLRGSDESMPMFYHDGDYCERARQLGMKCGVVPSGVVYHRSSASWRGDSGTSRQVAKDFRVYARKRMRFRRLLVWPFLLLSSALSAPLVVLLRLKKRELSMFPEELGIG